jgi:hypothetical protein
MFGELNPSYIKPQFETLLNLPEIKIPEETSTSWQLTFKKHHVFSDQTHYTAGYIYASGAISQQWEVCLKLLIDVDSQSIGG